MLIRLRKREGITILEIEGKISGCNSLALKTLVHREIIAALGKASNLLLKLEKVRMVDSAGLAALTAVQRSINQMGGKVALLHPGSIRNLWVMTKLMLLFSVFKSENEAIDSFHQV